METSNRQRDVDVLVDNYYSDAATAESAKRLRNSPLDTVTADARRLKLRLTVEQLASLASLLSAMSEEATKASLLDRKSTRARIEASIGLAKLASHTRRFLYALVYLMGLAFVWLGLYLAVSGDAGQGLVIGGVGAVQLAAAFARSSISGVQSSDSDLAQIRIAYTGFFAEIDQWQHRYTALDSVSHLQSKQVVASEYRHTAEHAIDLIDAFCKPATRQQKPASIDDISERVASAGAVGPVVPPSGTQERGA